MATDPPAETGTTTNPELWHHGAPVLPSHDLTVTAGFWGSLGFAIALDGESLTLSQGGVALHYVATPGLDPFAAAASAYLRVTNADLLHADLCAADVMPDLPPGVPAGDLAELRARWDADADLSRLGVPTDTDQGGREFRIFDPSNNRVTCGQLCDDAAARPHEPS